MPTFAVLYIKYIPLLLGLSPNAYDTLGDPELDAVSMIKALISFFLSFFFFSEFSTGILEPALNSMDSILDFMVYVLRSPCRTVRL